jgi:hypothetical protein
MTPVSPLLLTCAPQNHFLRLDGGTRVVTDRPAADQDEANISAAGPACGKRFGSRVDRRRRHMSVVEGAYGRRPKSQATRQPRTRALMGRFHTGLLHKNVLNDLKGICRRELRRGVGGSFFQLWCNQLHWNYSSGSLGMPKAGPTAAG